MFEPSGLYIGDLRRSQKVPDAVTCLFVYLKPPIFCTSTLRHKRHKSLALNPKSYLLGPKLRVFQAIKSARASLVSWDPGLTAPAQRGLGF